MAGLLADAAHDAALARGAALAQASHATSTRGSTAVLETCGSLRAATYEAQEHAHKLTIQNEANINASALVPALHDALFVPYATAVDRRERAPALDVQIERVSARSPPRPLLCSSRHLRPLAGAFSTTLCALLLPPGAYDSLVTTRTRVR